MGHLVIPAKLATTSVAWEGEVARDWLARLPTLVAEVADEWDLDVGPPLEPGGNISWVAPARRRSDGLEAIVKIQLPHPESAPEAIGLRAWAGGGAVRVFADDAHRSALLIERCRPGTDLAGEGGTIEAVRAGAAIGARLHAVAPPEGLATLEEVLVPWADQTAEQLEQRPTKDPGLARRALATMRTAAAARSSVLLHGDLNPTNVLAAEREPWLTIDPKPMVGDPAYDGPRLVTQPDPLATADPGRTLDERLRTVSDVMGVDRDALLEWCLVGAVEVGASAWWRGERARGESCDAHVALLAPRLP